MNHGDEAEFLHEADPSLEDWWGFITLGWSGNESVLASLRGNTRYVWYVCWRASDSGGRHIFRLPKGAG